MSAALKLFSNGTLYIIFGKFDNHYVPFDRRQWKNELGIFNKKEDLWKVLKVLTTKVNTVVQSLDEWLPWSFNYLWIHRSILINNTSRMFSGVSRGITIHKARYSWHKGKLMVWVQASQFLDPSQPNQRLRYAMLCAWYANIAHHSRQAPCW
jgi:hypothetical protein